MKIFELINENKNISEKNEYKKLFTLFDQSKKKFKISDDHYEAFLDASENYQSLYLFYRYLHELGQKTPAEIDFITQLDTMLEGKKLTLGQWLQTLNIIDTWLKKKSLKAYLDDIQGYISCLIEYHEEQNQYLDFPNYILLMLDEYGLEKAFST